MNVEPFEQRYRLSSDPWSFAHSEYERNRYQAIIGALLRRTYRSAFEPGCSIGELTAQLAQLCGHVTAADIAPTAVAHARERCAHFANVEIRCEDLTRERPEGPFDLLIFSEVGYYFSAAELIRIAVDLAATLSPGGEFVAAHWLGESRDHQLHGDAVHALLLAHLPLKWVRANRHTGFRIDTWICA